MTAETAWQTRKTNRPTRRRPSAGQPTPGWWRDAIGVCTWAMVLVTVALWVGHRGVQDLFGVTSGLTSLGRLSGLLCADLLLVQVLLMARIPPLERSYGQDQLARWHRLIGFVSFNLLLAHLLLVTLGCALSERANPVKQFIDLVEDYPACSWPSPPRRRLPPSRCLACAGPGLGCGTNPGT
jgi:predicted ferric reductase